MEGINILCLNYGLPTKRGELMLPTDFCVEFGEKIPEKVYMLFGTGNAWDGVFCPRNACISKLDCMMDFYAVKPYNIILLQYNGDGNFNTEIFNHDAVEINYPFRTIQWKKPRLIGCTTSDDGKGNFSDIDVGKMGAKFFYNAMSNSRMSYNLILQKEHLTKSSLTQVLSEDSISKLLLNEKMTSIQLVMGDFNWVINLKWKNGILFFEKEWIQFTETLNLREGETLVLTRCSQIRKFKVAILEPRNTVGNNNEGPEGHNWKRKALKIVTGDMLEAGDLQLPWQFTEFVGGMLHKEVKLILADGKEYNVKFCWHNNLIYGLKDLFANYAVSEGYFISFAYVGSFSFYITIYSNQCVDILNGMANKLILRDVRKQLLKKPILLCNSSEDSSSDESSESSETSTNKSFSASISVVELISSDDSSFADVGNTVVIDHDIEDLFPSDYSSLPSLHNNVLHDNSVEVNSEGNTTQPVYIANVHSFTITLTSSHVDQIGHGVYFARHMQSIYRHWKKGTIITLIYGEGMWKVALLRDKKKCRFGLGWNDFTKDNKFHIGQNLQFISEGNQFFRVNLVS